MNDGLIRPAAVSDIPAMLSLMRNDYPAVGFIPRAGLERVVSAGGLVSVLECGGELVGYGYRTMSHNRASMKMIQLVVRRDARMLENGRAVLDGMTGIFRALFPCAVLRIWRR